MFNLIAFQNMFRLPFSDAITHYIRVQSVSFYCEVTHHLPLTMSDSVMHERTVLCRWLLLEYIGLYPGLLTPACHSQLALVPQTTDTGGRRSGYEATQYTHSLRECFLSLLI